jgi:DNA-binding LacI/PurR family transcriptional regulator
MRELRLLCQQRPRAIICNTTDLPAEALSALEGYRADGGILVCYDRAVPVECDQVVFDRADNTFKAAAHLLELGHRAIGLFEVGTVKPTPARAQGLERALAQYHLEPRAEWLYGSASYGEFEDDGAKMAAYFLGLSVKPSAVCIVNDYAALAFISELQRAGLRVPEDVSVVGHDDRPIARYCNVPLTSVSHPIEAISQAVVDVLLARLNGDPQASYCLRTIQGELVVRQSTSKVAQQNAQH